MNRKPIGATPDGRVTIDPAEVAAAVGITRATGTDYQFTDAYGVTYTGCAAHLALSALARRDRTGGIYPDESAIAARIRATARTLIEWFTSPYVDPEHAAEFAALPALRVCDLVVYLCQHASTEALERVGPASLHYYTDHLLHDGAPSADHPLPSVVDEPYRSLEGTVRGPQRRLEVIATARGGAEEVAVPLDVTASEDIFWRFRAAIQVSVGELNDLLTDSAFVVSDHVNENREVFEEYLAYGASESVEGIALEGRLASPGAALVEPPDEPVEVEVFFAGPDRESALRTAPFGSRGVAEQSAVAGERIFSVVIEVDAGAVREVS